MRIQLLMAATILIAPAAAVAQDDIPRTASGRPDLSGTYDIATRTPMMRDPKYGDDPYMSAEDAHGIAAATEAGRAQADIPSDPDRKAPPVGGDGHRSNIGGHNPFWFDFGTIPFQIDGKYRNSIITDPPDGRLPPKTDRGRALTPRGLGAYNRNPGGAWWIETGEDLYDEPEVQTLGTRCLYTGGPTVPVRPSAYNNLKTITQTDTHVAIHVEWMHWTRIVRLDSEHAPQEYRSFGGDSVGWWEDDTLVVETTNFLRAPHVPHEGLRVVERFRRIDADTLFYEFTVEDSDYTAPYTGSLPWPRTDKRLYEYACHEGNYSMGNMLRGARLLEKEAREEPRAPRSIVD
ncbi:MAG: hypothetical protein F4210_02125 [Holophagales bacterium]|nr:hypothetical protein [Holophagales bacterium]MYF94309.1 hypothetical protein [Holophagales bacterium]